MKKQSIMNRKYLEKLEKNDPTKAAFLRYRRYRASAKSFILNHLKADDASSFKGYITEREKKFKK